MYRKRPVSSHLRPDEVPPLFEDPSPSQQRSTTLHSNRTSVGAYNSRYSSLGEPSLKRQRTSVDLGERYSFDPDRYNQRPYMERRAPFPPFPARDPTTSIFPSAYNQGPQPTLSNVSDYSFGHQRTNSSNTSSPFVSPHTEVSGHSWGSANMFYQPSMKDTPYTYPQTHYPDMPFSRSNQLTDSFSRQRTQNLPSSNLSSQSLPLQNLPSQHLSSRLPISTNFSFTRSQEPENPTVGTYGQMGRSLPSPPTYPDPSARLPPTDQQYPSTQMPNILPPLGPTLGSSQGRGGSEQILPNTVLPSIEPQTLATTPNQHVQEHGQESYDRHENYDTTSFNYPIPNQKRLEDG